MSVASVTARGRKAAEALMVDTCVIKRRRGDATTHTSGNVSHPEDVVYTGKCRVKPATSQGGPADHAGEPSLNAGTTVWIPFTATGVQFDDLVTVTSADSLLAGKTLRVRRVDQGTQITSHRILCEETP